MAFFWPSRGSSFISEGLKGYLLFYLILSRRPILTCLSISVVFQNNGDYQFYPKYLVSAVHDPNDALFSFLS